VTNAFGGRARPDVLGELQRSPRSIAAIGGGYLLLRERKQGKARGKGRYRKWRGRAKKREGKGEGRAGKRG